MNTYIVTIKVGPVERVTAEGFTPEANGNISFWNIASRTTPAGRPLRVEKTFVAFYSDVAKITVKAEAVPVVDRVVTKAVEAEQKDLANLMDRALSIAANYESMTPLGMRRAMAALQTNLDRLRALKHRLDGWAEDDDDENED